VDRLNNKSTRYVAVVHFYHEISPEELFDICAHHLDEIRLFSNRLVSKLQLSSKKWPASILLDFGSGFE